MTISESLIAWLSTFTPTGVGIDDIDTDILSAATSSFALAKEPTQNVKMYLSGRREVTEYYQLTARFDSQNDTDRQDNVDWFEQLTDWVFEQNKTGNLPSLKTGCTPTRVRVSSGFFMGRVQEETSVYQITIELTYTQGD